ncbi:MAG: hypothetical protein ACYCQJ_16005 [Nitrososphaerales archaeon]
MASGRLSITPGVGRRKETFWISPVCGAVSINKRGIGMLDHLAGVQELPTSPGDRSCRVEGYGREGEGRKYGGDGRKKVNA